MYNVNIIVRGIVLVQNISRRDITIDIAKGILIILVLIGHMDISNLLKDTIYSFHMAAFVFFSGYCFKSNACEDIVKSIQKLAKAFLFPYFIWGVFYIIMNDRGLLDKFLDILCGMTKSDRLFTERATVGQVYFLLLLFLIRVIYLLIHKYIKRELVQTMVVLLISILGAVLGKNGLWLPWSFDCALFALIFYHVGYLVKKYDVFTFLCKNKLYYVALLIFWMASIYQGGMSLYVREYGNYILPVLGALGASLLLYAGCSFISSHLPTIFSNMFVNIGKNTLSILLVHTIFGGYIVIFIVNYLMKTGIVESLNQIYIIAVLVQVILGLLWGRAYEKIYKALF